MDGCEWRIITCNSEMETTPANTSSRQITNGGHPPPRRKHSSGNSNLVTYLPLIISLSASDIIEKCQDIEYL